MTDLSDAVADDAEDTVHIVARSLARKYRSYCDRDDIVQELRVWCYEHPHKLMEWLDRDDPPERRRGLSALSKTLFRRGERWCRRQRRHRHRDGRRERRQRHRRQSRLTGP